MNDKQRALQLHESRLSYMEIAKALGIGKTTAYQYVKEARQEKNSHGSRQDLPIEGIHPGLSIGTATSAINYAAANEDIKITAVTAMPDKDHSDRMGLSEQAAKHQSIFGGGLTDGQFRRIKELAVPNKGLLQSSSITEAVKPHVIAEKEKENRIGQNPPPDAPGHVNGLRNTPQSQAPHPKPTGAIHTSDIVKSTKSQVPISAAQAVKQSPAPPPKLALKLKEFTGDELIGKTFECLPFTGKFLELIGSPSKLFAGMIWGMPKGGKSNFCIRFADYLQEYFGKVIYIAAEEGESVTLQEKFKEIGGSKVTVVETRDRDAIKAYLPQKSCDFVFIDSINNAGIDNDFLEELKAENPTKSFVAIVQATKGGKFKGDQALTHNCDFIIEVIDGIAYQKGRFSAQSEVSIFDEPLYEKNPEYNVAPPKARDKKGNKDEDAFTSESEYQKIHWLEEKRANGNDEGALWAASEANTIDENLEPLAASESGSGLASVQTVNQSLLCNTSATSGQMNGIQKNNAALSGTTRATPSRSKGYSSDISLKSALWITGGLTVLMIYAHSEKKRMEEQEKKKKAEQERQKAIAFARSRAVSAHAQRNLPTTYQGNRQLTGQPNLQKQTGVVANQQLLSSVQQNQQRMASATNQISRSAHVRAAPSAVYQPPLQDWEEGQNWHYGQNYEGIL